MSFRCQGVAVRILHAGKSSAVLALTDSKHRLGAVLKLARKRATTCPDVSNTALLGFRRDLGGLDRRGQIVVVRLIRLKSGPPQSYLQQKVGLVPGINSDRQGLPAGSPRPAEHC